MHLMPPAPARRRPRVQFALGFGLGASLLGGFSACAAEQAITMDGVARSASLMEAIVEICPPYGADAELAGRYAKAFAAAGGEAYGERKFATALQKERARRQQETRSSSAAAWCEEQKEKQKQIGDTGIFPAK